MHPPGQPQGWGAPQPPPGQQPGQYPGQHPGQPPMYQQPGAYAPGGPGAYPPGGPGGYPPPQHKRPGGTPGVLIAFLAALGLVLVAGLGGIAYYFTSGDDDPKVDSAPQEPLAPLPEASSDPVPSPEPTPTSGAVGSISGIWTGSYTCGQGKTALRLTLAATSAGAGGWNLKAVFSFGPHPSNPNVPKGSYLMSGSLNAGTFRLAGDTWIKRPTDYVMVDLTATDLPANPTVISGTVNDPNCTTFTVTRAGAGTGTDPGSA